MTALAVSALALTACTGGKDDPTKESKDSFHYVQGTKKGDVITAADRKLAGPVQGGLLAGGEYSLAQDKGKVVVLNFFASWCGPCQNETPQFDSIYRQRKAQGVQFVGMDVKDPSKSGSQAWLANKQITFPVVYDEAAESAIQLGDVPLTGLPATVVIDKQGRVAAVYVQAVLPADLNPVLDQLVKEA